MHNNYHDHQYEFFQISRNQILQLIHEDESLEQERLLVLSQLNRRKITFSLPDDLIVLILQFALCSLSELISWSRLNRSWNRACNQITLWKKVKWILLPPRSYLRSFLKHRWTSLHNYKSKPYCIRLPYEPFPISVAIQNMSDVEAIIPWKTIIREYPTYKLLFESKPISREDYVFAKKLIIPFYLKYQQLYDSHCYWKSFLQPYLVYLEWLTVFLSCLDGVMLYPSVYLFVLEGWLFYFALKEENVEITPVDSVYAPWLFWGILFCLVFHYVHQFLRVHHHYIQQYYILYEIDLWKGQRMLLISLIQSIYFCCFVIPFVLLLLLSEHPELAADPESSRKENFQFLVESAPVYIRRSGMITWMLYQQAAILLEGKCVWDTFYLSKYQKYEKTEYRQKHKVPDHSIIYFLLGAAGIFANYLASGGNLFSTLSMAIGLKIISSYQQIQFSEIMEEKNILLESSVVQEAKDGSSTEDVVEGYLLLTYRRIRRIMKECRRIAERMVRTSFKWIPAVLLLVVNPPMARGIEGWQVTSWWWLMTWLLLVYVTTSIQLLYEKVVEEVLVDGGRRLWGILQTWFPFRIFSRTCKPVS